MRVVVCGGRDYQDRETLNAVLDHLPITELAHGACSGADTLAGEWALSRGITPQPFPAQWSKHRKPGRKNPAGPIRNGEMLRAFKPDAVIAFAGNDGTRDCTEQAKQLGILVRPVIFTFGSNLAGRHGKGSALRAAKEHGAVRGVGFGLRGSSYAVPTKDHELRSMDLHTIGGHVKAFLYDAARYERALFRCVAIGCGEAGYTNEAMAPLFAEAPSNVILPSAWVAMRPVAHA